MRINLPKATIISVITSLPKFVYFYPKFISKILIKLQIFILITKEVKQRIKKKIMSQKIFFWITNGSKFFLELIITYVSLVFTYFFNARCEIQLDKDFSSHTIYQILSQKQDTKQKVREYHSSKIKYNMKNCRIYLLNCFNIFDYLNNCHYYIELPCHNLQKIINLINIFVFIFLQYI